MTKQQAIDAMKDGARVRHEYFYSEEWMEMESATHFMFEDGVRCKQSQFWSDRTHEGWLTGWEIIDKTKP